MNAAVTGETLEELVMRAGSCETLLLILPHPLLGPLSIYLAVIGTTRLVLGAAGVVSVASQQGLVQLILRWMGVPKPVANPTKRRKLKAR